MDLRRFLPDGFTAALVLTVVIASLVPCRGVGATVFDWITDLAIALLFFLHGAKLPRQAVVEGARHWRLHAVVLASTFVVIPLLGLALKPLLAPLVTPELYLGVLFLCTLPSTVQSSIAFTSIARGNVPAAIVSASASSLIGILVTPLLVGLVISTAGDGGLSDRCHGCHRAAAVAAFRRRPGGPALDRRLGPEEQDVAGFRRPRLDPAGGVHRFQRGGAARPMEADARTGTGAACWSSMR